MINVSLFKYGISAHERGQILSVAAYISLKKSLVFLVLVTYLEISLVGWS